MQELNENRSAVEHLLKQFVSTADLSYKAFNQKLKVSLDTESIMGIRMPIIRRYAKLLSKHLTYKDSVSLLLDKAREYYEFKLLFGLLLQNITPKESVKEALSILYSLCDGWAVSDLYKDVLGAFAQKGALQDVMASINEYKDDNNSFARRLTIVAFFPLLKFNLVTSETALAHIESLQLDTDYYVEMANAWLLAELTITNPSLSHSISNPALLKKYRQKLRDSYRI